MSGQRPASAIRPWERETTRRGPGSSSWGLLAMSVRTALETRTGWVTRQVTSGTSGSLSANMGRFLPGALSHWLQGAAGQIGISPGKAPAGQPVSAARGGREEQVSRQSASRVPVPPAPEDSCAQRELVTLLKLKRVISHVVK